MIVYPNAKINLGLNVLSKRSDGFHNIETCFYPIGLSDILEFVESDFDTTFSSTGIDIPGNPDNNLCVQAWELLSEDFNIRPVKIHLHKIVPIGAGLGGGSSDGAFMLKALNDFFSLGLSFQDLKKYASKLGSDCAFFIENIPSLAKGRGEVLEPSNIEMADYKVAIVNPGLHVSTPEAYSGVNPKVPGTRLNQFLEQPVHTWEGNVINDFEVSVFKKYPEIERVKRGLYELGAKFSLMSGSGSSVFGIFRDDVPESIHAKFAGSYIWVQKE